MVIDWSNTRVRLGPGGRVRCEPGWRLTDAFHQKLRDFDLWFVWAGRGRMWTDAGGEILLRPGMCFWMRPGGVYIAEQDLEDRLGVSFIHFDLIDAKANQVRPFDAPLPPVVHDVPDVNFVDAIMRRVAELLRPDLGKRVPSEPSIRSATALFTGLLTDLDARSDRPEASILGGTQRHHYELVMKLASRISESPKDVPPISELAEEAGYSPDHFARVFRRILGQTPQAFAVQARINRGCQLLLESDLTVTQIADALGYDDVFFFSKQFKQKTGLTPKQYRNRPATPRVERQR